VYDHLDARERAAVLAASLHDRPELQVDVERLATAFLGKVRVESVAVEVRSAFVELGLADRSGRCRG
jgi:hypothetical protein